MRFTLMHIIGLIPIIAGNFRPSDIGAARIGRKGHFALFNCLVLGHTKYKGVQRIYCNPSPNKMFYGSHRMDPIIIRPPGVDNGALVVSPETVWYARVLLLFSASAMTEPAWRKVPYEHDASACLGHATVCSGCALTILIVSLSSSSAR
jgi:hypothetical protein